MIEIYNRTNIISTSIVQCYVCMLDGENENEMRYKRHNANTDMTHWKFTIKIILTIMIRLEVTVERNEASIWHTTATEDKAESVILLWCDVWDDFSFALCDVKWSKIVLNSTDMRQLSQTKGLNGSV
jgi:hypothetical protein